MIIMIYEANKLRANLSMNLHANCNIIDLTLVGIRNETIVTNLTSICGLHESHDTDDIIRRV